jgi:putative membrane protein
MKRASLISGILILAGLWLGPLPELTRSSFAAHMALHMGVVAIAAPLIALGIAGGPFDFVRRWPAAFPAIPWSIAELVVVWSWHAPTLHYAARAIPGGLVAEQISFFVAGLAVWLASVSGPLAAIRDRAGAGITALLLTSMHMTLLGALIALTPRALYSHAAHVHDSTIALTPIEDQHLGGAIMLAIGGVSYLAGGLALVARLVRQPVTSLEVRA